MKQTLIGISLVVVGLSLGAIIGALAVPLKTIDESQLNLSDVSVAVPVCPNGWTVTSSADYTYVCTGYGAAY